MKEILIIILGVVLFNTNPNKNDFIEHMYGQIEATINKRSGLTKKQKDYFVSESKRQLTSSTVSEKNYYLFSIYTVDLLDRRFSKAKDGKVSYVGIGKNFIRLGDGPLTTVLDNIEPEQLERLMKEKDSKK